MSGTLKLSSLSNKERVQIHEDLQIKLEDTQYTNLPPRYIYPYQIEDEEVYLPFAYAYRTLKLKRHPRDYYSTSEVQFKGVLRPEQIVVKKEAIDYLNRKGSIMISAYTGFGKTAGAINLACSIGFRTLIIVNKIVLMKQWEESIRKFSSSDVKIQRLTPRSKVREADFYIMNAINVPKMGRAFFKGIGLVIVDEAHLIMAETLSRSLQYLSPRYLIGLTATPYRPDGLDKLLELYFGKYKIIRKLWREHLVYRVNTGFLPKVETARNGRVNWGTLLDSQAKSVERNELIVRIIRYFKTRTFLILTKRIEQGEYLVRRLAEEGETVTSLLGKQQTYDVDSRILVGTNSKIGTGFDHPKLDALLLAADVQEYFIQYLGRCMRTQEVKPLIFDLCDRNRILERHYATRQKVYMEHGGTIQDFSLAFPQFK